MNFCSVCSKAVHDGHWSKGVKPLFLCDLCWNKHFRHRLDKEESTKRKAEGMELATKSKHELLDEARKEAIRVCETKGYVTADDICDFDLGPAAGSVFKDKRFEFTGGRVLSAQPKNHGRELKVWRLKK